MKTKNPFSDGQGERLLERILLNDNTGRAYNQLRANKANGVCKVREIDLLAYLVDNSEALQKSIIQGSYDPNPSGRMWLPKYNGYWQIQSTPAIIV